MNIYLVKDGTAELVATPEQPGFDQDSADGIVSIHVAAASESEALDIASAYDRGELQIDNMAWPTGTIAVVCR